MIVERPKTLADYAAIAVAPLLIFVMISSLANFLMLVLYRGSFPGRVSWTLLMFTLGAVGIARVAIERDRVYSLGYAGVLGMLSFLAMLRFVDSPLFSALMLTIIGYLSDRIVRDCTLIDEAVDSSDQGLIDSGRLFVRARLESASQPASRKEASAPTEPEDAPPPPRSDRREQPGRTVMYLALAALPLFGLGQFFLRDTDETWRRAVWLLILYLFSSLSLLVTTSFLGLRRYLRQRQVEMPQDVSIGWLGGGLAVIAALLVVAYLAPLPGQALASLEFPSQLDSPGGTSSSRFGWGNEGAEENRPGDRPTAPQAGNVEAHEVQPESGAPEGNASDGQRKDGPAGQQPGGSRQDQQAPQDMQAQDSDRSSSDSEPRNRSQRDRSQRDPQSSQQEAERSPNPQQGNGEQPDRGESADRRRENELPRDRRREPDQHDERSQTPPDPQAPERPDEQARARPEEQPETRREEQADSRSDEQAQPRDPEQPQPDPESDPARERDQGSRDRDKTNPEPDPKESPRGESDAAGRGLGPLISGFVRAIILLALLLVVGFTVWKHGDAILAWWRTLFGGGGGESTAAEGENTLEAGTKAPPRPFSSFREPFGLESDPRKILVVTFQAFEAWSRERGATRSQDETPSEFIRRSASALPRASHAVGQVVDAYNRIVYGRGGASEQDLSAARAVWQAMRSA